MKLWTSAPAFFGSGKCQLAGHQRVSGLLIFNASDLLFTQLRGLEYLHAHLAAKAPFEMRALRFRRPVFFW